MKQLLSYTFVLLGVGLLILGVYQANQYLVQQATIEPSLKQLEQMGDASLSGFNVEETKALLTASTNALIQGILIDLVLGLLFLAAGIWIAPGEKHK